MYRDKVYSNEHSPWFKIRMASAMYLGRGRGLGGGGEGGGGEGRGVGGRGVGGGGEGGGGEGGGRGRGVGGGGEGRGWEGVGGEGEGRGGEGREGRGEGKGEKVRSTASSAMHIGGKELCVTFEGYTVAFCRWMLLIQLHLLTSAH